MSRSVFLVVVTDVDGTLLDHDTYSFAPAVPALQRLQAEDVPLILCSSKTRAEIEGLQKHLGIAHPFISENGGALFVPDGYFGFPLPGSRRIDGYQAIEFGRPYAELVSALRSAASALRLRVTGFSDMTDEQVAHACNLSLREARLARKREYDEPFSVHDADAASRRLLHALLRERGFRCTAGGRFDHVTGPTDKGRAIGVLRMLYRRAHRRHIVTVGLGDAPNDLCLLREVEIPIVIRRSENGVTEALLAAVPYSRVSRWPGPLGWNEQIEEVVEAVA